MENTPVETKIGTRGAVAIQILLWTLYAVVHFLASMPAVQSNELGMLAVMQAVRAGTGCALSLLVLPLLARLYGMQHRARWPAIAGLVLALTFAWMVLDRVTLVAVAAAIRESIPWHSLPRGFELEYLLVVLVWATLSVASIVARRNRILRDDLLRHQIQAQEARLQVMMSQLNPHFLFNTLNMIRSLISDDPSAAREMLTRMSALLRRVVSLDATTPVPLQDELTYAEDYLHIHEARFGSALQTSLSIAPGAESVLVPPLLLQPLLENAVKFGSAADGVRRIRITADLTDTRLDIRVWNTGRLDTRAEGAGWSLTRRRLQDFYGAAHTLTLSESNGEVVTAISIEVR